MAQICLFEMGTCMTWQQMSYEKVGYLLAKLVGFQGQKWAKKKPLHSIATQNFSLTCRPPRNLATQLNGRLTDWKRRGSRRDFPGPCVREGGYMAAAASRCFCTGEG